MDMDKLQQMLGQAQQLQGAMEQKAESTVAEASSGGGLVTARVNGRKELLRLTIAPTALQASAGDIEMLEDLITAAVNEAGRNADAAMQAATSGMLGGMDLGQPARRVSAAGPRAGVSVVNTSNRSANNRPALPGIFPHIGHVCLSPPWRFRDQKALPPPALRLRRPVRRRRQRRDRNSAVLPPPALSPPVQPALPASVPPPLLPASLPSLLGRSNFCRRFGSN